MTTVIERELGRVRVGLKDNTPLRGPRPPSLVCPCCDRTIHANWPNPFLETAKRLGMYRGETTGGVAVCLACAGEKAIDGMARRYQARMEAAGIPLTMRTWTLDTYPGQRSPYLTLAKAWLEAPTRSDIVLFGPPGTGKTGLAIGLLRALVDRSLSGVFIRAAELLMRLRSTYRPDAEETEKAFWARFTSVQLLVLDDLTALKASEHFDDTLVTLLDIREKAGLPSVVTVNLLPTELAEFFGAVLYDRLREHAQFWHLDGGSQRGPLRRVK